MPAALAITDTGIDVACATPTAQRTRSGVASVTTGTDTGYIYVVGGAVNPGPDDCVLGGTSTPLVQRGTVAADGTITWATLSNAYLPSPRAQPSVDDGITNGARTLGVEGASVVIVHTKGSAGDHYYLYVIGGKSRYLNLADTSTTLTRALATVYYSEINISDGSLKHPTNGSTTSVWARDKNIDLVVTPSANEGLWDATATATSVTVGNDLKSAIFLAGGSLDSDTTANLTKLNPYVYRADVNKDTGALTWAAGASTVGSQQVTLAARRGMTSVAYNNKLYMIGGRTADGLDTGVATVPTAFYDDNLDLIKLDATDFFIGTSDTVLNQGGAAYRSSLGAAVVRAEPPTNAVGTISSAWVFVLGGNDRAGAYRDTVFLGKIGGDEASDVKRVPDGWYYSGVIKTSFEFGTGSSATNRQARVLAMHWATDIDRAANPNADIKLEFRKTITATGECPSESVFTSSTEDRWRGPIDGFTSNSTFFSQSATSTATLYNGVTMADIFGNEQVNASCIQYRAHLMQNATGSGASSPSISPKLLSVYIEKVVVGNADLNIPENGLSATITKGGISAFSIKVQNLSDKGIGETLSVPEARLSSAAPPNGSFYVFLCMARTDLTQAAPSLTLPDPNALPAGYETNCPAAALIEGYEMDKGTIIDLRQSKNAAGDPRWYSNTTNQPISDIMSLFEAKGHYKVGLVIDPLNLVPEGITTGETNNRGETAALPNGTIIAFDVTADPVNILLLPLVWR
jgi:hypothetical protein